MLDVEVATDYTANKNQENCRKEDPGVQRGIEFWSTKCGLRVSRVAMNLLIRMKCLGGARYLHSANDYKPCTMKSNDSDAAKLTVTGGGEID